MSLDGFVAGPEQNLKNPLGIGGFCLHEWAVPLRVWRSMHGMEGGLFVLTHHAREPLALEGGTTFTFVTDGIEPALEQARRAAGGKDVSLAGAKAAQQYLIVGLVDEMEIQLAPVLLGNGERLFDGVRDLRESRARTHGRRAERDASQVCETLTKRQAEAYSNGPNAAYWPECSY